MTFAPEKFANLSKVLARDGNYDTDSRARTCYGRAYYALFLAVRTEIWRAEGRPIHGRGDEVEHGALTDVLFSSDNPKHKALGRALEDLYTARKKADYVLEPSEPWNKRIHKAEKAREFAKRAQSLIRQLDNIDFTDLTGQL